MRGEHFLAMIASSPFVGSSPHARGTPGGVDAGFAQCGIIPACAGNTTRPAIRKCGRWDHPRMRGEHAKAAAKAGTGEGSSPHARGTHPADRQNGRIPKDHPRMRGEHVFPRSFRFLPLGSSPHARGTPAMIHVTDGQPGIIPACAGNTGHLAFSGKLRLDHPRMRGEHLGGAGVHVGEQGSSPHARGTRFVAHAFVPVVGIIPACAGNTRCPTASGPASRDHPRMRGEHSRMHFMHLFWEGSSPHARGTQAADEPGAGHLGIIPACAGNTPNAFIRHVGHGDHPRMRGEHITR